jgi:hypothetical protein
LLYLDCCMRIRCRGNPFIELLLSDSPSIVGIFTGLYLEKGVCLSAYCVATAVLVSAQQRVYTPQYYILLESGRFAVNILLVDHRIIVESRLRPR